MLHFEYYQLLGFALRPRLPIYERHLEREGFLEPSLRPYVDAAKARLERVKTVRDLAIHASASSRAAEAVP